MQQTNEENIQNKIPSPAAEVVVQVVQVVVQVVVVVLVVRKIYLLSKIYRNYAEYRKH